ncbi:MAG: hypothetical protein NTZ49_02025 [Candidatus Parcubacteria bacterium]|nr:hypothetical protein [Candidatus Parcubacteria bacterium]
MGGEDTKNWDLNKNALVRLGVIAVLLCLMLFLGFIAGSNASKGKAGTLKAGEYHAYSVQKAFTPQGNPIYWILAEETKDVNLCPNGAVPVIQSGTLKFYEVPRERVTNLEYDSNPDPKFNYQGEIIIK